MKKDKKVFILIEVVLAMLVLIVLLFMFQERADQGVKKIAVIVPNSDHSRWASFKYGLQMAETDFDVETVVVSTGETLTEEEEAALMESEIDNGADGILVQPAAGEGDVPHFGKAVPAAVAGGHHDAVAQHKRLESLAAVGRGDALHRLGDTENLRPAGHKDFSRQRHRFKHQLVLLGLHGPPSL